MKAPRLLVIVCTAGVFSLVWALAAGMFSWGYYSTGWEHNVAIALAAPFFVAKQLPVPELWQGRLGFAFMFLASLLPAWVIFRPRRVRPGK